ncbi:MAG: tetratricopeptide repeat protein [Candidatus Omnitrophica bacterium]|nr:tetratricopeptide repeat protein [Candidatus Omnitrophota bacterium]
MNFWLQAGILTAIGFLLYANTLHGQFHLDDDLFIVRNPTIRDITNWALIGKSLLGEHARHVVFFTLALNYHLNKLDVFGYHLVNTLIHILTAVGIWQFTRLLLSTPRFSTTISAGNAANIAFGAALLFLCHPANTQAVSYITQRFASLATMFYIASLAFYLRARLASNTDASLPFFLLAGISALLGIFSKEITITLPLMALVIDRIFISYQIPSAPKKSKPAALPAKVPAVLIAAMIAFSLIIPVLFHFNLQAILSMTLKSSSHEGDILNAGTFFLTQLRVMIVMLRLLILPVGQNLDYDFPMSSGLFTPVSTFLSLLLIIGMVMAGWKMFKRHCFVSFAILWFLITWLPEFYPRVHVIFEHKLYLTSIGFFIAVAWLIWEHPVLKKKAVWITLILTVILGVMTVKRNEVWQTELALWNDVVAKSPHKARPYNNRGIAYFKQGQLPQAVADYNQAIALNPTFAEPYNNRGYILSDQGNFVQAMADFNKAIDLNPDYAEAYNNRGFIYGSQNDLTLALKDYNKAIALNPDYEDAYTNRAIIYARQNNIDQAMASYDQALKINPDYAPAYFNRAATCYQLKEYKKAWEDIRRAKALGAAVNPNLLNALTKAYPPDPSK